MPSLKKCIIKFFKTTALINTKWVSFESFEFKLYHECSQFDSPLCRAELFAD